MKVRTVCLHLAPVVNFQCAGETRCRYEIEPEMHTSLHADPSDGEREADGVDTQELLVVTTEVYLCK